MVHEKLLRSFSHLEMININLTVKYKQLKDEYTLRSNNTPCIPDRDLHAEKREEELVRKKEELDTKEKELDKKEEDLSKKIEELVKKQEQLDIKEEQLNKKEEEFVKKHEQLGKKEEELNKKEEEWRHKEGYLGNKEKELDKKEEELRKKEEELRKKDGFWSRKEKELDKKEGDLSQEKEELVKKEGDLSKKEKEMGKKKEELRKKEEELREKEEKPEPTFTEDYLRASIEWKMITEDKLSDIVKWVTEIKQNDKSALICSEIKDKLGNKYGFYWTCFYGKTNDESIVFYDSSVKFKFKEMDDKKLFIYRTEGKTFINFNQTQIRNSISTSWTYMDQEKQNKAVEWVEEALIKYTDANGKERKGIEICTFMQNKFQSEYKNTWMCMYSLHFLLYVHTYNDQERIMFSIYQQFNIVILRQEIRN